MLVITFIFFSMNKSSRNISLDIARGICIFLIVLSHSFCTWKSYYTFYYVQVFFFLSGVFFNYTHTLENSLYKKVKSLIFPYVFFSIIYSLLVLITGRATIENLHIYDPDSFDNGPQWFLISLFTSFLFLLTINQIGKNKYITIIICVSFFILGYYFLALHKIDDYTQYTKSILCIPFLLLGSLYLKYEPIIKKYKYYLLFISAIICFILVRFFHIFVIIRWLQIPSNPILYLFASTIGILFIISLSLSFCKIKLLNKVFSFWGRNSLFILCIHWPIVRMVYGNSLHSIMESDIISITFCIIVCYITSYIGVYLRKYFKSIF